MSRTLNANKPWNKPPSWFKRLRRQAERARNSQRLREGREPEDRRRNDQWDWT
jgi:hypothetical protein